MNKSIKAGLWLVLTALVFSMAIICLTLSVTDDGNFSWSSGWNKLSMIVTGGGPVLIGLGLVIVAFFGLVFLGTRDYQNKSKQLVLHALIGVAILVVVGIVGFKWLPELSGAWMVLPLLLGLSVAFAAIVTAQVLSLRRTS